ncbi:MAG: leucyl aminopeptidase [Cyanobacteria bacterium SIG26]|nr:leucyl aminopeptidase [Cyanobacteria bacterium SIG26]
MEIKIVDKAKEIQCDVLIIAKFEDLPTSNTLVNRFAPDSFTGKKGEIFVIHTQKEYPSEYIIAMGLGKKEFVDGNIIRETIAKAIKKCSEIKAKTVAIELDLAINSTEAIILGTTIANYHFDKYKTKKEHRITEIYLENTTEEEIIKAKTIADGVKLARNLSNEPAAFATPTKLAEIAQGIEGLQTEVYDEPTIREMKMGAYLAVAQGSTQPPKFIHMKHLVDNPKKRIAIIGKGMCFDSGGLDIKPAASMLNMKDDMSGSACVLGVMKAIAKLRPEIEVHGIIAACENMPSGNAYKPGDILTAKNGKTIEVDNTDAEGRLTLADALCYACDLQVDEIIDIATLTGACMVALGSAASGIMGNNDEFVKKLIETGKNTGEKFWQLPMWQEYRDNMNSDVADMKNTGSRYGGASAAGMFLKEFVCDNVKWAHMDVAGTAFLEKPQKEFSKGATGVGVRTILNYIISQ